MPTVEGLDTKGLATIVEFKQVSTARGSTHTQSSYNAGARTIKKYEFLVKLSR